MTVLVLKTGELMALGVRLPCLPPYDRQTSATSRACKDMKEIPDLDDGSFIKKSNDCPNSPDGKHGVIVKADAETQRNIFDDGRLGKPNTSICDFCNSWI